MVLLAVQLPTPRAPHYRVEIAPPVVEQLGRVLRPGDGLWTNLLGTFALAAYAPWPSVLEPSPRLGVPHPVPNKQSVPHFAVLNPEVDRIDALPPLRQRIFVFACHDEHALRDEAVSRLRARGYASVNAVRTAGCSLELMAIGADQLREPAP